MIVSSLTLREKNTPQSNELSKSAEIKIIKYTVREGNVFGMIMFILGTQ
jgi:hypothetical protein